MYTTLSVVFLIVHVLFALFILYLCISFLTGGPFVPSSKYSAQSMVDIAEIKPGMIVYDLGSGDGRILLAAAKRGARAIGIEMNPFLVLWSRLRAFFSPHRANIKVRWQNLWKADFSDADIVFVYLLPMHMDKLQARLKRQLRKGSLVVSNSFIFPHWQIFHKDSKNHIYVFKI